MGPLGTTTYRGRRYREKGRRPSVAPDYGGRGKLWTFGAFEPQTGQATIQVTQERKIGDFVGFLDHLVTCWPQDNLILILDNLNIHKAHDVLLWALQHPRVAFLFQPTYAPWLNLIEPWWKTLRSLALKGNYFERVRDLALALHDALAYWNTHRKPYTWRKNF